MTADSVQMRRRLRFRSWHRGTREMDLLLGRFADVFLDRYDAVSLSRYARLLEESDPDIYDWVTGRVPCEDENHVTILRDLARFHSLIGKAGS